MADINKIFKDLQDHAEAPPRGLYAKLWKKIRKLPAANKILLHTVMPPNVPADNETALTEEEKTLRSLQTYIDKENTAPAFDYSRITEALAASKKETPILQKNNMLFWIYRTAAAAAVTGIIVVTYVYITKPDKELNKISSNKQSHITDTVITKPAATIVLQNKDVAPKKTAVKVAATQQLKSSPLSGNTAVTKNTGILNNDFLYTFTSFNTSQANKFFADIKKDNKVSMNSYSYVNVSDKMAAFLKQMYAVNRKNKNTWKARRLKAKLNRWKKEDEKNFDTNTGKNPLDILDLSEFIFKN